MRVIPLILITLCTVAPPAAQDAVTFGDDAAASLFRTSRMNVSGREATVRELTTLRMIGRIRVPTPEGAVETGATDIRILLPDRYLRIDVTPSATRYSGVAGETLLNAIRSGGGVSSVPDSLRAAALDAERRRLAFLMLGATTYVTADLSPTMESAGYGVDSTAIEAVDRRHRFLLRLVFGESMLPMRIEYPGGAMTFSDRRLADGLQMPFRITTTAGGGRLVDEITFDTIRVNVDLSQEDFRISAAR